MKEGWIYKKLGEVCDILDSKRKPITKSDRQAGDIPYYGATGVQDYVKDYIFDGRFLLVGEDGAKWGKDDETAYIIEGKSWVNNHAHVLKLHDEVLDLFLKYYLNGKDLNSYITGAVVPKLTQAALVSIPIPVPPIETQSQIVNELDLLQSIIDKQKAQLKELDNLAKAVFYDMFGDPVVNEKGWVIKKLKEIGEGKLTYGSGASAVDYDGKIRYIRITDIEDNGSLKKEKVSPSEYNSKYLLNEGDVLFARSGATVGKTYLHKTINGECIYAGYLIRLIPNNKLVLPEYVFGFTKTAYYNSFIASAQKAVAQPNINAEQYGNLLIGVPPLSLQQSFAAKIESIEKQKAFIAKSLAETQKLFDFTMDKYFG